MTRMFLLGFVLIATIAAAACSSAPLLPPPTAAPLGGTPTPTPTTAPATIAPTIAPTVVPPTATPTTVPPTIAATAASTTDSASAALPDAALTDAIDPQDAAKNFFVAIYSGQDTSALVCSTFSSADPFIAAAAAARSNGESIDTSGLTFKLKSQSGTTATVTVAGQLAFGTTTADFPSSDVSTVNEGGIWKYCGRAS